MLRAKVTVWTTVGLYKEHTWLCNSSNSWACTHEDKVLNSVLALVLIASNIKLGNGPREFPSHKKKRKKRGSCWWWFNSSEMPSMTQTFIFLLHHPQYMVSHLYDCCLVVTKRMLHLQVSHAGSASFDHFTKKEKDIPEIQYPPLSSLQEESPFSREMHHRPTSSCKKGSPPSLVEQDTG